MHRLFSWLHWPQHRKSKLLVCAFAIAACFIYWERHRTRCLHYLPDAEAEMAYAIMNYEVFENVGQWSDIKQLCVAFKGLDPPPGFLRDENNHELHFLPGSALAPKPGALIDLLEFTLPKPDTAFVQGRITIIAIPQIGLIRRICQNNYYNTSTEKVIYELSLVDGRWRVVECTHGGPIQ